MRKKLAVARFWYEGNSFSPLITGLKEFQAEEWLEGSQVIERFRGVAHELGGVITFQEQHRNWDITFLHCCAAPPGGPMEDEAFITIKQKILEGLASHKWDAVYLSLHGAAITVNNPTPDLELLKEARAVIGATPLGVTFDFHANLSKKMVELCDVAIGYKTYPHIDMAETALAALRLLTVSEPFPRKAFVKLPIILPSFNMRTQEGPMAHLIDIGRKQQVADLSLFGGFAYGDTPFFGPSIIASADKKETAEQAVTTLASEWRACLSDFFIQLPKPEEALRAFTPRDKPIALLDPADNPLSGGIGDTTFLLRALIDAKPSVPALFAFFYDPPLVERCHQAGEGGVIDVALGGRIAPQLSVPIEGKALIRCLTEGVFRNSGPMWHGARVELGKTALLELEGIQIIVTQTCQTPNDPGYFHLHGIALDRIKLLCVKAKNHFRAAFKDLTAEIIDVDCPGPAALNLKHFSYRYAKLDPLHWRR